MKQRIFSREELESMGVPDDLATKDKPREGVALLLDQTWIGETRWGNAYSLVFRAPDNGMAYEVTYESPATEMQEGMDPFNDEREVTADEVEPHVALTVRWRKAGNDPQQSAVPLKIVEEALREHYPHLDYDMHKYIECNEDTGEDTYPQEAEEFSGRLERAIRAHLI